MESPTKRVSATSIGSKRRFLFRQRFPQHHDRWEALATEASRRHNDDVDLANPATVEEIAADLGDDVELILDAKSFEDIWLKPGELTAKARNGVRSYLNDARDYSEHLEGLSRSEVDKAYALERAQYDEVRIKAAASLDDEEFYNSPEAEADFSHWLKAGVWHADEAIALSRGKDPQVVNQESLRSPRSSASPFRIEYKRRKWLVERAIEAGQLNVSMTPNSFIEWAKNSGFELPPEMLNYGANQASDQGKPDIAAISGHAKRQYSGLLRIVTTLLSETVDVEVLVGKKYASKDDYVIDLCTKMRANGSQAIQEVTVVKRLNEAIQLLREDRKAKK
ncbi:hypothetical protein [Methylobacterium sp. E-045]|uniref:hypothetical protein n=1 Tax=Methylobacterium sp. E-045 TaxID=2836575 RepID=UPI001FBA3511|nr:hypothetical protein [Methylobacterium sp. E-045]MCJ2128679.1 hypothetical protein [Methylobacterium sp. E-045]